MRTVKFPTFAECFFKDPKDIGELWADGFVPVLLRGLSHPRVASTFFILLFFFIGLWSPRALCLAMTLSTLRFLAYVHVRLISERISLSAERPLNKILEGQTITLHIKVHNQSYWKVYAKHLRIQFSASRIVSQGYANLTFSSREDRALSQQFICDAGMGRFPIGPITLQVGDLFGLYEVTITEFLNEEIKVFPKIRSIPEIETASAKASDQYGFKEIPVRGVDVNFAGVRPFITGDNIRHIAWRRSARLGQLIVKEFERLVPSDISLFVNLNPSYQVGSSKSSTWDSIKKLAISLSAQIIKEGHSLRFGFNKKYLEKGFGEEQLSRITQSLLLYSIEEEVRHSDAILYKPTELPSEEQSESPSSETTKPPHYFIDNPLHEWQALIPQGSTLFYITALNYTHLVYTMEITKKLLAAQTEVVLFLITPLKIWEFSPLAIPDELDFTKKNHTQLHNLLRELRKLGVRIYNLNMGDDVSKHTRELDFKDLWGSTP